RERGRPVRGRRRRRDQPRAHQPRPGRAGAAGLRRLLRRGPGPADGGGGPDVPPGPPARPPRLRPADRRRECRPRLSERGRGHPGLDGLPRPPREHPQRHLQADRRGRRPGLRRPLVRRPGVRHPRL
ncbi:MAG: hypothetical protein AVDCRST_MAG48-2776, partial [uncultured Friedmanniella sp.]